LDAVPVTAEQLEKFIDRTGALISVSVGLEPIWPGRRQEWSVAAFCERIGLAFQVIDDILDATDGSNRDG
jgi:geranylgeranyl pyrophosphate synthase